MTDAPKRIWVEPAIAEDGTHGSTAWPHEDADWPEKEFEYHRTDLSAELVRAGLEAGAHLAEDNWSEHGVADAIRTGLKSDPEAVAAIVAQVMEKKEQDDE